MTTRAGISVTAAGPGRYRVEVTGGHRTTSHTVEVGRQTVSDLAWTGSEADLLVESFLFLLEREPQTSILGAFDLEVIGRYFPEYPEEIGRRAAHGGGQSP